MPAKKNQDTEMPRSAVFEAVFDGMANGKTVADVARELGLRPGTVRKWLGEDDAAYTRYQRMRPLLGAAFAEEAVLVARNTTNAASAADRLLVETLKWAAAKSAPADYGERQTVEHQGQQTLQVKVIEEERPVKNVQALKTSAVAGVLQAGTELPADLL
jgi:predicted transcriptional regulator